MLLKSNSDIFLGEFSNDQFHKGIFNLENGDKYEGEFKNIKFNGEGIY